MREGVKAQAGAGRARVESSARGGSRTNAKTGSKAFFTTWFTILGITSLLAVYHSLVFTDFSVSVCQKLDNCCYC